MANDRMILKCKGCGAEKVIAKTFGSGYCLFNPDKINEWMHEHRFCNSDNQWECKYQDFELHYESESNNEDL